MRRLVRALLDRTPYLGKLRALVRNEGAFVAGHFYSPVPLRGEALGYLRSPGARSAELPDIRLNDEGQLKTLRKFHEFYAEMPFPEQQNSTCRYYFDQAVFCYADAIFLYSFLRH